MKKVTRKEWIAALRSGEYKQTKGVLLSPDGGMCCLGVAAHLAGVSDDRLMLSTLISDNLLGVPGLWRELGLMSSRDSSLDTIEEAANRNDGNAQFKDHPQSFAQIADWLETLPE